MMQRYLKLISLALRGSLTKLTLIYIIRGVGFFDDVLWRTKNPLVQFPVKFYTIFEKCSSLNCEKTISYLGVSFI